MPDIMIVPFSGPDRLVEYSPCGFSVKFTSYTNLVNARRAFLHRFDNPTESEIEAKTETFKSMVRPLNDLRVFATRSRRGSSVGRTRGCEALWRFHPAARVEAADGGSAGTT